MTHELDRYIHSLAQGEVPQPKEVFVRVLAPGTDALVDEIDDVEDELGSGMQFSLANGEAMAWAKVMGNPWDLHDVLGTLRAVSERLPALAFEVSFDPDGTTGSLEAGRYEDVPADEIAAWVAEFPRPKLAIVGAHIVCHASTEVLRPVGDALAPASATVEARRGALDIRVTRATDVAKVVRTLVHAVMFAETWKLDIEVDGWRRVVSTVDEALAVDLLVSVIAPRAPWLDAEPEVPVELPLLVGEQLEHVPPYEVTTPPGKLRRTLGVLDGASVIIDVTLRLGRIKTRFEVGDRKTRAFINVGPSELDTQGRRIVLVAERDGANELLAVDLDSFSETMLQHFGPGERAPRCLVCHASGSIGVIDLGEETVVTRGQAVIARVPGANHFDAMVDGDALYLFTTDLYRVSLATGDVRCAGTSGNPLDELRTGGTWRAWKRMDEPEIVVANGLEPAFAFRLPPHERDFSMAISPTGVLALVTEHDDQYTLRVIRGEHVDTYPLAGPAEIRWRSRSHAPRTTN